MATTASSEKFYVDLDLHFPQHGSCAHITITEGKPFLISTGMLNASAREKALLEAIVELLSKNIKES
jgi:hypothetical protein